MIQLTRRERRWGMAVAVAVTVWGIYAVAVKPMRDRIELLHRILPEKQTELRELQARSAEYLASLREIEAVEDRMAQQAPDFQLLPFLESLTERQNLPVTTMQQTDAPPSRPGYSETVVEIGVEGITLSQLIGLLRAIEDSEAVTQIGSLHIRKSNQDAPRLDATIQIGSPKANSETVAAAGPVR
ncbi:MAG: type II secretion system protein GspM [Planctomycetota bacterium]|nr:type II secretion system protein GspM [Planctomycetota bacterium]